MGLLCLPFFLMGNFHFPQIYISGNTGEQMPIWCPPTPPQDKGDIYMDLSTCFLYEPNTMPESQLPPIYIKKETKRARVDASTMSAATAARKQKMRKDDTVSIPKSLFDRPTPAILRMRRDMKMQRFRATARGSSTVSPSGTGTYKPPVVINKPMVDTQQDHPEWLIQEDWALLQAVQSLLDLPLNLLVLSPAHIPNWDLVSDIVNATTGVVRSPKQCKTRYESVIIPREEGKILYDTNPKKQKKSKGIYRTKNNRPMRTSQLFIQDNNSSYTQLYNQHIDAIKTVANKRTPTLKPIMLNPSPRNPKHVAILSESNINYDSPLTPVQAAANRAERILREKQKQALTAEQQQQQLVVQQQLQRQPQVTAISAQAVAQQQQQQQQALIGLTQQTMTAQQLQSVIGRIAASPIATQGALQVAAGTARTQRTTPTAVVMQDMLGVSQVRQVAAAGGAQQTLVSMTSMSPTVQQRVAAAGQVAASQQAVAVGSAATALAAAATPVTAVTAASVQQTGKALTTAQIQLMRTQSIYKQQQRLQQVAQQQVQGGAQVASGVHQTPKVSVAVTSLLSSSVGVTQQQQQQRVQTAKQAVARQISEVQVAQLIKQQQQQLQQQKAAAAAAAAQVAQVQVPTAQSQMLSQAHLQQQMQQATAVAGQSLTNSSSLATLVKTVATPASLTSATSPSVTIPVGMAGVNINVSLPAAQVKTATVAAAAGKGATIVTQQQQLQQIKLQQHILQQRKLQQQKAQLAQVQAAAKAQQLGTVQIVQQGAQHKTIPTTVTVQQIPQVMKQVHPQTLQQVAASPVHQALPHAAFAKTASTAAVGQTVTAAATVSNAVAALAAGQQQTIHARVIPVTTQNVVTTLAQQQAIQKQTIQMVTAGTHQPQRVSAAPNVTIDASGRPQPMVAQHSLVATAAGSVPTTTTLAVTLPATIKVSGASGTPGVATLSQHTPITIGLTQIRDSSPGQGNQQGSK